MPEYPWKQKSSSCFFKTQKLKLNFIIAELGDSCQTESNPFWNAALRFDNFGNRSYCRCFLVLVCLFFQRLTTLTLPNSSFQGADSSIFRLSAPGKVTAPHDVAPEETQTGSPAKNFLDRNSRNLVPVMPGRVCKDQFSALVRIRQIIYRQENKSNDSR